MKPRLQSKILLAALLTAINLSTAYAWDAKDLRNACKNNISDVIMYILGIIDKRNDDKLIMDSIIKEEIKYKKYYEFSRKIIVGDFCLPQDANLAMLFKQTCTWMSAQSDNIKMTARGAVFSAFESKWPCSEK